MIYVETGSTDVYYNFGVEYYLASEKKLDDTVFMLWRTTPTLMVGKYQNTLEEINRAYAEEHGIPAASGLSMLLHQGAKSLSIWTGLEAPVEVMRKALLDAARI